MKKRYLPFFVATLATLFITLTASAQGEWKWAHCWSSACPNDNYNTIKNVDFDDEGNIYVLGSMGGSLMVDGSTFLFLNNPQVYYNQDYGALIVKYDTMGNMLWHKEVKTSRDSWCIPHWLEVRDNKVYVMGNGGLTDVDAYSDDQAWHYWLDTLITGSQVRPIPRDQRVPPRTVGRWTYLATFDLDGNLLGSHFVQAFGRKIYANNNRAEQYLSNGGIGIATFHVDSQGNTYIFTQLNYDGPSTNPYTLVVDGDTNRKYDIYFPEGSNEPGISFSNIMIYKFSPDWELLFTKQLIDHSDGIGLSIGDTMNPLVPYLYGFSFDEEDNMYLSGFIMNPPYESLLVTPQFPAHIYWDSTHYATIYDYSLHELMPYILKINSDGEVLWSNQIYSNGSPNPSHSNFAGGEFEGCHYFDGRLYLAGSGGYRTQGSVYFDDPSHPLSQMVENQLNIGFFVSYDAMTGHYVSHGIVPANNAMTTGRPAAINNRVFAYSNTGKAIYQWREDGLFIHADSIYTSSGIISSPFVNGQGYMVVSFEQATSPITFSDNVSVCGPTASPSAGIALYHNPEFATPYVGIPSYDGPKPEVRLYPNPASDRVTIESEEDFPIISVSVANMQGTILTLLPVNDVRCTLNVRNLASGSYIAHVETKAGISDVKFVVGRN